MILKKCSPFLPNQFFSVANCSVCGILYIDKMLFTSQSKCFSSLYLSSASQLKVGCFMAGPSILGPAVHCHLFVGATAIVCIATLVASSTALAITSLTVACSLASLFVLVTFNY